MKKILFVLYDRLECGGVQNVIMQIVRGLRNEYIFDIVVFDATLSFYDEEFENCGGKIFRLGRFDQHSTFHARVDYYLRPGYIYRNVLKIINNYGPYEVIHCHNALEAGLCLLAGYKAKIPIRIAHSHTSYDNRGNAVYRIYIKVYLSLLKKYSTKLVGCSRMALEKQFETNDGMVIPNGVDIQRYHVEKKDDGKIISLIQVATFTPNKNQIFSLEVLNAILKYGYKAKLTLVGRSSVSEKTGYVLKIQSFIRDNNLEKYVQYVSGYQDVVDEYIKNKFLIFPSLREGFGIVPVEAQAAGLNCFVSDTVPKDIDCGGCEFLSLNAGPIFWANRIIEKYNELDGENEFFDCSRFDKGVICEQYKKMYEGEI